MSSPKDRALKALENHHRKLANKQIKFTRRNGKPEKEVERFCLQWMRERNWDVQILESKAVYNANAGRYLRTMSVSAGTCDCIGTLPNGLFVAIEFKAPGRLATFASDRNHLQRDYIINKIKSGCFACVTDSAARLEKIYNAWLEALQVSPEKGKDTLLSFLPTRQ